MNQRGARISRSGRYTTAALLALALVASSGCGSTQLLNMWRDPQFNTPGLKNFLVVAIRKDATRRRLWEDSYALELTKEGVSAAPSYRFFPDQLPDTVAIREKVREGGFDAVLVSSRLETQAETRYVPGYTTTVPVTVYRPYWGVYSTYYQTVYHEGYTETDEAVRIETEVWTTAGDGHMVWSGISETVNPASSSNFIHDVADLAIDQLRKSGIIRKPTGG